MPLHGHCNCNAIQVTIQDLPNGEAHQTMDCHCTTCRRQSGGTGTYVVLVDDAQIEIKDPKGVKKVWKDTLTDSGNVAERHFCGECGCPVVTYNENVIPGKTVVKMGLFDEIPPAVIEIYTKNKQSWESNYTGSGVTSKSGAP